MEITDKDRDILRHLLNDGQYTLIQGYITKLECGVQGSTGLQYEDVLSLIIRLNEDYSKNRDVIRSVIDS